MIMPVRKIAEVVVIEAPSNLGLKPPLPDREPGTRRAPAAFRDYGLYESVGAARIHRVEAPPYDEDEPRRINIRNMEAIAEYSMRLADVVETELRRGAFPLVIGGDCSILLGSMLGLNRIGNAALIFIDGHPDFFLPEQSTTGGAAGMDLALATGWGPAGLTNIERRCPYLDIGRVAAIGMRDEFVRPPASIPLLSDAAGRYVNLARLREAGIGEPMREALQAVTSGAFGHWIHLDVDVIDSELMPAVDSPQPDGLSWDELERVLRNALEGDALGLQITIYDPDLDPGLVAGRRLARLIADVLSDRLRTMVK